MLLSSHGLGNQWNSERIKINPSCLRFAPKLGVDFDPLLVPLISQSIRTKEHVNDNHIEWPPIQYTTSCIVANRRIEKAELHIFVGHHFFPEMSSGATIFVFIVDSTLRKTVGNVWIWWLIVSADDNTRSCDVKDQSGMKQAKTTMILPNHLTNGQIWPLQWRWPTQCHRHPNTALLIVQTKKMALEASAHSLLPSNGMKKWSLRQESWWTSHSQTLQLLATNRLQLQQPQQQIF